MIIPLEKFYKMQNYAYIRNLKRVLKETPKALRFRKGKGTRVIRECPKCKVFRTLATNGQCVQCNYKEAYSNIVKNPLDNSNFLNPIHIPEIIENICQKVLNP